MYHRLNSLPHIGKYYGVTHNPNDNSLFIVGEGGSTLAEAITFLQAQHNTLVINTLLAVAEQVSIPLSLVTDTL